MTLLDEIAEIIRRNVLTTKNKDGMGCQNAAAAILDKLPSMLPDLVWVRRSNQLYVSGVYSLNRDSKGWVARWNAVGFKFYLTRSVPLEDAKASANEHNRATLAKSYDLKAMQDRVAELERDKRSLSSDLQSCLANSGIVEKITCPDEPKPRFWLYAIGCAAYIAAVFVAYVIYNLS